jgi:aspartate aminotransferase-like enzyme
MSTAPPRQRPVDAPEYAAVEAALASLLRTRRDLVLLQGESLVGLEAMARGVGAAGSVALNVITSPYGAAIGRWLAAGGARVENLDVGFERAVTVAEIEAALRDSRVDTVSVVHAEAATGAVNPLAEIAEIAHRHGALVITDAVASVGAEPLEIEAWDLDIAVIGAQKALAGPTGVCAVALSERAWTAIERNPTAPRDSVLSLLDWRAHWIAAGRRQLPLIAHDLETRALAAAIEAVSAEGIDATIHRHRRASTATRAGLRALRLEPWIADDATAAAVATLVAPPPGLSTDELLADVLWAAPLAPVTAAPGPLATLALRINHTGQDASLEGVISALAAIGVALLERGHGPGAGAGIERALAVWGKAGA